MNRLNPVGGWVQNAEGELVNLVDLLGGVTPVDDKTYPLCSPNSGLVIGSDNKAYDITKLLGGTFSVLPEPDASNAGKIVQYSGETTETLTHGHFYECIETGPDEYEWSEVPLGSGGGGSARVSGTTLIFS